MDTDGNLKKVDQMVPFSVGKRMCMGEPLARMELFLIFANMMQKFRIDKVSGEPYPDLKFKDYDFKIQKYICAMIPRV